MVYLGSGLDELHITEEGSSRGRMCRRKYINDDVTEFKSKNLHAERNRRQKLSGRLLALRALVPIITNMNKATIVDDAITYIEELKKKVEGLQELLFEMEAPCEDGEIPRTEEIDAAEEMKISGIQAEVEITQIDKNKLWMKIIFQKKSRGFTKLMEAMRIFGFELIDTSVTTCKGAMLVSSCVEGIHGAKFAIQHTRELLLEILSGI